jgi:hypothetical protein
MLYGNLWGIAELADRRLMNFEYSTGAVGRQIHLKINRARALDWLPLCAPTPYRCGKCPQLLCQRAPPLFAGGVSVIGLLARRRKRKAAAIVA